MNINNLSLPHPILGIGDDINSEYNVDCEKEIFVDRVSLKVVHNLDNNTILEAINNGFAVYAVEINCPQTVYRQMFLSEKAQQEVVINADDLRGKVVLDFFIIAVKEIQKYKPASINEEYKDAVFSISAGEVMGYGGSTYFYADKRWKESESVSSFMCIVKSNELDGPIEYNLMSERINIALPEKDFNNYKLSLGDFKKIYNVYHGALVYPALLFALIKMFNNNGDEDEILSTYAWHEQLSDRLDHDSRFKDIKRNIENAPLIAQILLSNKDDGMPISRTLECIKNIIDDTYKIKD